MVSLLRGLTAHRGSLRLQLTFVFGLLFFLAAFAVLAGVLILIVRYWDQHRFGASLQDYAKFDPPLTERQRQQAHHWVSGQPAYGGEVMRSDLRWMVKWGSLVVLGVGVSATAAGWMVAGRLLRPLAQITHTAERIAGRTLHERIALQAPPGEVKTLADSFDRMLERLDKSFAGQDRFIANAAHELKTPLALNRTLVEVAMKRHDATAPLRRLGESLLTVNTRQERLIDALLALARAENDVEKYLPTDLRSVAATVLEAAAPAAAEAGVTLRTGLGRAPLHGDPVLLEQLARNLVDNAIRYNHAGGFVLVTTATTAEGTRLTVANTGIVIAPHEVPTLFQPFRRLTDRVGSAKGNGLGLSIVQAIARAHHGDAHAFARPDGGLAITVTFPRPARADGAHQPDEAPALADTGA